MPGESGYERRAGLRQSTHVNTIEDIFVLLLEHSSDFWVPDKSYKYSRLVHRRAAEFECYSGWVGGSGALRELASTCTPGVLEFTGGQILISFAAAW